MEDDGDDCGAGQHNQRDFGGAAKISASWRSRAQCNTRVQACMYDQDSRRGLQRKQEPQPPAPGCDRSGCRERCGQRTGGEGRRARDLKQRGPLTVLHIDGNRENRKDSNARAHGHKRLEGPGSHQYQSAQDQEEGPAGKPTNRGGGFRMPLLPDEVLTRQYDRGVFGG